MEDFFIQMVLAERYVMASTWQAQRSESGTLDILNLRHQKEKRITNSPDALAFRYGKINTLTNLRLGLGRQNVIFGKELKKGVEISYNYVVGLSVGFLKPVYLEVVGSDGAGSREIEKIWPWCSLQGLNFRQSFLRSWVKWNRTRTRRAREICIQFWVWTWRWPAEDDRGRGCSRCFYKETELLYNANNHQVWVTFYAAYIFGKKKDNPCTR